MKHVFTDSRFPGCSVENRGDERFVVAENGQPVAAFRSSERPGAKVVSEDYARRQAEAYFDRMERWALMESPLTRQADGPRSTPVEVERAMARVRAELDPTRKKALEQRVVQLMQREESLVDQVVHHLLYER